MPIIYLSPSLQPYNEYVGGGNEQQYMNLLADQMVPYLRTNGIQFTRNRPGMTLAQAIRESNSGYYDLHLALHSNAAPPELSGKLRGADAYYYQYSTRGKRAADIIVRNYKEIYPDPSKVRALATTKLAEVTKTNAPAVLLETAYHDNVQDVEWLKSNLSVIAANLVKSLTEYFGIPFITPPQPERAGTVSTAGGNLNLRSLPSLDGPIIAQIPNGSPVTIYGEWDGWYVTGYNGSVGYASARYIE